jgi:hypothetical protein
MLRLPFAAALLLVAATLPCHGQAHKRFMGGPVTLEDQGSFFVGGVTKVSDYATVPFAPPGQPAPPRTPQQITIGQMYVQFQIPARRAQPGWPVIMVHGSTHTGAALESTPDGREGWYPYFVRKGVATYVGGRRTRTSPPSRPSSLTSSWPTRRRTASSTSAACASAGWPSG